MEPGAAHPRPRCPGTASPAAPANEFSGPRRPAPQVCRSLAAEVPARWGCPGVVPARLLAGGWITGPDCGVTGPGGVAPALRLISGGGSIIPALGLQMGQERAVRESASREVAELDPRHLAFGVKPDFIRQLCWSRYQGQPESAATSCVALPELLTLSGLQFSAYSEALGCEDL